MSVCKAVNGGSNSQDVTRLAFGGHSSQIICHFLQGLQLPLEPDPLMCFHTATPGPSGNLGLQGSACNAAARVLRLVLRGGLLLARMSLFIHQVPSSWCVLISDRPWGSQTEAPQQHLSCPALPEHLRASQQSLLLD